MTEEQCDTNSLNQVISCSMRKVGYIFNNEQMGAGKKRQMIEMILELWRISTYKKTIDEFQKMLSDALYPIRTRKKAVMRDVFNTLKKQLGTGEGGIFTKAFRDRLNMWGKGFD